MLTMEKDWTNNGKKAAKARLHTKAGNSPKVLIWWAKYPPPLIHPRPLRTRMSITMPTKDKDPSKERELDQIIVKVEILASRQTYMIQRDPKKKPSWESIPNDGRSIIVRPAGE